MKAKRRVAHSKKGIREAVMLAYSGKAAGIFAIVAATQAVHTMALTEILLRTLASTTLAIEVVVN